ncbi:MAG: hypothetical protein NTU63_04195 [Candidatus Pacearchaeota archaeon]|nr:hypothetical protein [Candidatus Pacearchaeota archaeon]
MNDSEYEVLKKYRSGAILDTKDRYIVDELTSTGFMTTGFRDSEKKESGLKEKTIVEEIAGLSKLGIGLYRWESIKRSLIRKRFHNFIHSI